MQPVMSAEELQARIDKALTDIDHQKEVLRQLERNKSDLQRQLNGLRDPVARLPFEISSVIFRQCLPLFPVLRAHAAPVLLLSVCNTWSDIAVSTPELWAAIPVNFVTTRVLETSLKRALNHPVTIYLRDELSDSLTTILGNHVARLKHLDINNGDGYTALRVGDYPYLPFFTGLFPHLETLVVHGTNEGRSTWQSYTWHAFKIPHILEFLSRTPNLAECTFHDVLTDDDGLVVEEILVLPNLTCLKFGKTTGIHNLNSYADILRYLSLPALETLFFSGAKITSSDFSLFLERSSPPLRKLVIGDQCNTFSVLDMEKWMCRVPFLVHLEMAAPEDNLANDLVAVLAETSSDLIPDLQILRISHEPLTTLQLDYQGLLLLLSSRRAKFVEFKLVAVDMSEPDPQVRDGLLQLVAGGMKIYIGTEEENFISSWFVFSLRITHGGC